MQHSKTTKPRVIILSGYGLNCEDETAFAFETAGAKAEIVHINDAKKLSHYQILAIPGGFSFGDDTGSGKAFAHKLKERLGDQLQQFLARDTLMIGICNGFQILTSAGILPGALTHNDSKKYISKWVEIERVGTSPWLTLSQTPSALPLQLKGELERVSLPIAHGEGKYIPDPKHPPVVAFRYLQNPNGSTDDIAGILGYDGRVLGMMPHPERAQFEWQSPPGISAKGGSSSGGQIFKNAISYFK